MLYDSVIMKLLSTSIFLVIFGIIAAVLGQDSEQPTSEYPPPPDGPPPEGFPPYGHPPHGHPPHGHPPHGHPPYGPPPMDERLPPPEMSDQDMAQRPELEEGQLTRRLHESHDAGIQGWRGVRRLKNFKREPLNRDLLISNFQPLSDNMAEDSDEHFKPFLSLRSKRADDEEDDESEEQSNEDESGSNEEGNSNERTRRSTTLTTTPPQ